jgi:hypothetical protein
MRITLLESVRWLAKSMTRTLGIERCCVLGHTQNRLQCSVVWSVQYLKCCVCQMCLGDELI